jgi:hypothetical protein
MRRLTIAEPRGGRLVGAWLVLVAALAGCAEGGADRPSAFAYELERITLSVHMSQSTDVLLVVDDAPAMRPFQAALARSLEGFLALVPEVVDQSPCGPVRLGVLAAGGDGRLADQVGTLTWEAGEPRVSLRTEPACRVVGPENLGCLFDTATSSGTALVGFGGSPYPRPLSALRRFLGGDEARDFLRPEATLVVLIMSAGEDCGEPGEVAEGLPGMDGRICAYAARGVGPDGSTSHPDDPARLPYALTPVAGLHDELVARKGGRAGMVRLGALVGVADPAQPEATILEYLGSDPSSAVRPACTLAGCAGEGCGALPGTRAIALASAFGLGSSGLVGSICEPDWSRGMITLAGTFISCPGFLRLPRPVLDPALLAVLVDGQPLSPYSCTTGPGFQPCEGPGDPGCECAPTYTYEPPGDPPDPGGRGGALVFSPHYDLCRQCPAGPHHPITYEIAYVVGR